MTDTAANVAMTDQALAFRREAGEMRAEAMRRYPTSPDEARSLELSASTLIRKAANIERGLRGLPPLQLPEISAEARDLRDFSP